jgi:hypothetical protein
MSGMGSTLQLTNSTVVAAFRSALIPLRFVRVSGMP